MQAANEIIGNFFSKFLVRMASACENRHCFITINNRHRGYAKRLSIAEFHDCGHLTRHISVVWYHLFGKKQPGM
jgi:hypothetical protein